jgi:hypothetical protein
MTFQLIAWIYISLICFAWGKLFVKYFSPGIPVFDFSISCIIGFSVVGIISMYFSLFGPLYGWVKLVISAPALIFYLQSSNRKIVFETFTGVIKNLSAPDRALLSVCILMLLFLSSSTIIHPDTLNYHADAIRFFNDRGMVRGIANVKLEYGFQSLWFAAMAFFDLSFLQPHVSYPLSGCLLCWFIIFLVAKSANTKYDSSNPATGSFQSAWWLILLLFTLFSWTQIRLTASSASPDFIVAICIFLSLYFLCGNDFSKQPEASYYFAVFFAVLALSIKLSAVIILLAVVFVLYQSLLNRKFRLLFSCLLLAFVALAPLVVRNIFASGYPLYPSSLYGIFPVYWKMDPDRLLHFQHYITAYARYPVDASVSESQYQLSIGKWVPIWWRHLYISDKLLLVVIGVGAITDLLLIRTWMRALTLNRVAGLCICILGTVVWFIHAPDPRFGTGFLLPLIYFQYSPLLQIRPNGANRSYLGATSAIKWVSAFLILLYIGYRGICFFQPEQLIYPEGIKRTPLISSGTFYHTPL